MEYSPSPTAAARVAICPAVRTGTYDAGGATIRKPVAGSIASSCSSLSGAFRRWTSGGYCVAAAACRCATATPAASGGGVVMAVPATSSGVVSMAVVLWMG